MSSDLPRGRRLARAITRRWPVLAAAVFAAALPTGAAFANVQHFGPSSFINGLLGHYCASTEYVNNDCPAIQALAYQGTSAIRAWSDSGPAAIIAETGSSNASGVAVKATSTHGNAIVAQADSKAGTWTSGILAIGDEGVVARGTTIGVDASANGTAAAGVSNSEVGGYFAGKEAPIRLAAATTSGAPTSGLHHKGEFYVDSNGLLFYCTADGTPGTWHQVAFKN